MQRIDFSTRVSQPPNEGPHIGRVIRTEEKGVMSGRFGDQRKLKVTFELDSINPATGKHYQVSKLYNLDAGPGGDLYKHAKLLLGDRFNPRDFGYEDLLHTTAQVIVEHRIGKDGISVFGNVGDLRRLPTTVRPVVRERTANGELVCQPRARIARSFVKEENKPETGFASADMDELAQEAEAMRVQDGLSEDDIPQPPDDSDVPFPTNE